MATGKAQVTLHGRFPAGTRLRLVPRNSDFFNPPGVAVATAKVDKDSKATFGGLEDGAPFWVAAEVDGQWRSAAVTAKVPVAPKERTDRPSTEEARPQQAPGSTAEPDDSKVPKGENPAPHVRQQDVPKGTVQRSDTPLGQATPKDPDELQPKLPQSEVPAGVFQRSDTPLGEATIIPAAELENGPKPKASPRKRAAKPKAKRKPAKKAAKR